MTKGDVQNTVKMQCISQDNVTNKRCTKTILKSKYCVDHIKTCLSLYRKYKRLTRGILDIVPSQYDMTNMTITQLETVINDVNIQYAKFRSCYEARKIHHTSCVSPECYDGGHLQFMKKLETHFQTCENILTEAYHHLEIKLERDDILRNDDVKRSDDILRNDNVKRDNILRNDNVKRDNILRNGNVKRDNIVKQCRDKRKEDEAKRREENDVLEEFVVRREDEVIVMNVQKAFVIEEIKDLIRPHYDPDDMENTSSIRFTILNETSFKEIIREKPNTYIDFFIFSLSALINIRDNIAANKYFIKRISNADAQIYANIETWDDNVIKELIDKFISHKRLDETLEKKNLANTIIKYVEELFTKPITEADTFKNFLNIITGITEHKISALQTIYMCFRFNKLHKRGIPYAYLLLLTLYSYDELQIISSEIIAQKFLR